MTRSPAMKALVPAPISRDVVKAIAMDIGKAVAHHIETMYPAAVKAASSTFLLSVRNCTHNEIMAALETTFEPEIVERLAQRKKQRRKIKRMYAANRRQP